MTENNAVFHVQSPILDAFITEVHAIVDAEPNPERAVRMLRPAFSRLLGDETWLPQSFTETDPSGGMAKGIGNYLIYRSAARDLSLMSLVVPHETTTPVHDHLAWGLVGLYQGEQMEHVYRCVGSDEPAGRAELVKSEERRLRTGEFYELLPPAGDIHRVTTLGSRSSVSLHLLGNDIGCVWRHTYDPDHGSMSAFRSGYSNEPCPPETSL
jgi:predicted metal-dependent enzyme (double-stranded beta helix superfamily)